ncbi:MAG: efflux RND transporter periplasmic adaptor subunit [Gemmataceae bacterium]|nr:efflux RND transporter periplasmic adaptor subunit [Gemmataceae bacterium]
MSANPEPQIDPRSLDLERRRLSQRLEEISKLCESDVPPGVFYGELLKKLLESLAAPVGAIWIRTNQGNLQLQFQANLKEVGLDKTEESRQSHEELLRQVVVNPRQVVLLPRSGLVIEETGKSGAGNPTDFLLLLVPISLNNQLTGIIEVFQGANRAMNAVPGFMQYMALMADLATRYQRNQMLGQMLGQQQIWTQVEGFSRLAHSSLNPVEVAYQVANDGRRLINCDRVSVAVRYAQKAVIEAISGADIIERRSNLVRLMQRLVNRVMDWGEKLVFNGAKDDTLPPRVLEALDGYLGESGSKLLVVLPLRDEREKDSKNPPRSLLVMESFDPPADPQQLIARLDVVSRHATSSLYNSLLYRRIPFRFLWLPLAKVQEGLGGAGKAITLLIITGIMLIGLMFYFVPYPLKMDAVGQLQPEIRRKVFSPVDGIVKEINVQPGDIIAENRALGIMHDGQLEKEIRVYRKEIQIAARDAFLWEQRSSKGTENERLASLVEAEKMNIIRSSKEKELEALVKRTNADLHPQREGFFFLKAPGFSSQENLKVNDQKRWMVLSNAFQENLANRAVKPSEELLRLGAVEGPWEIELKIPQQHIGQVLRGFERLGTDTLDVDFLIRSDTTRKFKGKLPRKKIGGEANPEKSDGMEAEPVIIALVQLEQGVDPEFRLPKEMLLSGIEVQAKIRCGNERMGYSLFYGLWEFFYEKVVFFF